MSQPCLSWSHYNNKCSGARQGKSLTYLSGDALTDSRDCLGPQGQRYPYEEVARFVRQQQSANTGSSRSGRAMNLGEIAASSKSLKPQKISYWLMKIAR